MLGLEGDGFRDARIYVDGRSVGNYEPEETILYLPAGKHAFKIRIDGDKFFLSGQLSDGLKIEEIWRRIR